MPVTCKRAWSPRRPCAFYAVLISPFKHYTSSPLHRYNSARDLCLLFLLSSIFHSTTRSLCTHKQHTSDPLFLKAPTGHARTHHIGNMLTNTLVACTALLASSLLSTVSAKMTYETKGPEMIHRRDTDWKYNPTNYLFFDPNDDPIQPKKECTVEVAETRKLAARQFECWPFFADHNVRNLQKAAADLTDIHYGHARRARTVRQPPGLSIPIPVQMATTAR